MRALSDALPTGHRPMANPTHFDCGRATPPVSHSHNWPSGRMQNFCSKLDKKLFFANKDPKTNFDDWMILQKHVLSFKCNDFLKMANLKAISSSATLRSHTNQTLVNGSCRGLVTFKSCPQASLMHANRIITSKNRGLVQIVTEGDSIWRENIKKIQQEYNITEEELTGGKEELKKKNRQRKQEPIWNEYKKGSWNKIKNQTLATDEPMNSTKGKTRIHE